MNRLPKVTAQKIEKLAKIAHALRSGSQTYFSITSLTSIKSLCKEPTIAAQFVTYLATKIQEKVNGEYVPQYTAPEDWKRYKALINESVPLLQRYVEAATPSSTDALRSVLPKLREVQKMSGKAYWGQHVRTIYSVDVLIVENAIECILTPWAAPMIAYETARNYCERYNPSLGNGLIPESVPMLEDVVAFWHNL